MPRSLSIKFFIFSLITWVAAGCTKATPPIPVDDSTSPNQEVCEAYVFAGGEIFDTYITTGPQFARPFFNPTNADEFVYVRSGTGTYTELVKHKISTRQETVLCNSMMIPSQPQWGSNGWIVFSVIGNVTWKVKDNGTGLSQISPSGVECYNPIILADGQVFMALGTLTSSGYLPVFNIDGILVDSVHVQHGNISIGSFITGDPDFKNGYYRFYDTSEPVENFGYCKLNNNQSVEKLTSFGMASGEAIAACKNNERIFYARYQNGLYELNIASHQVEKIIDCCQSRYINSLSMSPDGKNILYERVCGHQTTPGGMVIDEQSEIFIYNTVTKKEMKIIWEQ